MASDTNLKYMINHVFLPPKLPQDDDQDVKMDFTLLREIHTALIELKRISSHEEISELEATSTMAHRVYWVRGEGGTLNPARVDAVLQDMKVKDVLAINIRAQNAGLIIRKQIEQFTFESFELSPMNSSVMSSKGRLVRCFPGPAIGVDSERVADPTFRDAFVQLITRLDVDTLKESVPTVVKAGSRTDEIRDTVHPKMVTEMLTGILRGIGRPADVARIHKRTRDDVLWKNTLKPWRRSSLWMLLRVALQTTLMDNKLDHTQYKSFMIFFMARLLEQAITTNQSSDILFIMSAKIGRRALKLGLGEENIAWVKYVHVIVEKCHGELTRRWNLVQLDPDPLGLQKKWRESEMSFDRDTKLSLNTLRPYITGISTRSALPRDSGKHNPIHLPRIVRNSSTLPIRIPSSSESHKASLWLMDMEQWVQNYLDDWVADERNLASQASCILLSGLINDYSNAANLTYVESPENISLALLTLLELWVALDNCATHQIPLLRKYEPGFPKALFDPLLLPQKSQMQRLHQAELHIETRRTGANHSSSFIFEHTNKEHSFAVKYFEQSIDHQNLRQIIVAKATADRAQKKKEFEDKARNYDQLIQKAKLQMHQENGRIWNIKTQEYEPSHHENSCPKCATEREAQDLQIDVHEWPLPESDLEAKATVFELDVPEAILRWRDTTYKLLVDVFSPKRPKSRWSDGNKHALKSFAGLSHYVKCQMGRLQLASPTKSYLQSHYRVKFISQATEKEVCVNNGLRYSLCDFDLKDWTPEFLGQCDVQKICTLQLPTGIYKSLQWALDDTTHTTNEILARQSQCPKELDQHQYYAFGALRSGSRLQWRNIARELVARIVNFSHEETYLLVVQAAWQAGCSNKRVCREIHTDLEEEDFGVSLISVLEDALGTVEGSWQNAVAVKTFLTIAARLLSVSQHTTVHSRCHRFLRRARAITLSWAREVSSFIHDARDGEKLTGLNLRALELFLLCHYTYHVDQKDIPEVLKASEDVAILIECCIGIRDRCPTETTNLPQHLKRLVQRHEKLAHIVECKLRELILKNPDGIDNAIHQIWPGYLTGSTWSALNNPAERWMTTTTDGEGSKSGKSSLTVHYNILDGTLLVGGLPLTRLPRSYESHETYKRLFGEKVLEVIPSTLEGMKFETRSEICGRQVHFRMCGSELIIRSTIRGQVEEVIPITAMLDDFPKAYVHDYVHWLDLNTNVIEWRRLKEPWASSPENWRMKPNDSHGFSLSSGNQRLIDVRSSTAKTIFQVLSPLENATHIHIVLNCGTKALEINLPRMKLDFLLKDAAALLESKQFRGMVLDEKQSFGAFTGLVNKIILRETRTHARTVLIPHGYVSFAPEKNHIRVEINTDDSCEVKYHAYLIDSLCGRLLDNGSLQSRLFKLYLHATTSHCLIDKLTGRTGTEEALNGLRSGATRSFFKLESSHVELLQKLGDLTPRREFYPSHLQVMQEVHWGSLSPLSQHFEFYTQSMAILNQVEAYESFQEHPEIFKKLDACGQIHLLERAAIRESAFQVDSFGAEKFSTLFDSVYKARDQSIDTARELRTFQASKLVDQWPENLAVCPNLLSVVESWPGSIRGPNPSEELMLEFDTQWLEMQSRWFSDHWCQLQKWLSRAVVSSDKYKILIFLSVISYSTEVNQQLVRTLLAFATVPGLSTIEAPNFSMFQLSQGYRPAKKILIKLISKHAFQFRGSPESKLPKLAGEEWHEANERREALYTVSKGKMVEKLAERLIIQWPTAEVFTPASRDLKKHISVDNAVKAVCPYFENWHQNSMFQKYIQQVQNLLNQLSPEHKELAKYSVPEASAAYTAPKSYVTFQDMMKTPAPTIAPTLPLDFGKLIISGSELSTNHSKLDCLLKRISSECSSEHEHQYAKDLRRSFEDLSTIGPTRLKSNLQINDLLGNHFNESRKRVADIYQAISVELERAQNSLYRKACLLPRICSTSILSQLASDASNSIPVDSNWKQCLVDYGLSITCLQRAERLVGSISNKSELLSEMENTGHSDWDPIHHSEWLLLEIENNILIRQEQAQIAQEMMFPSSSSNSVMQLNMGLGKSSVIVPIVAAALADGKKLVRVVVLKPLAMQMFQLLAKKLGGMINRRVCYMPISRSLNLSVHQASKIRQIYEECMENGSILLVQPEHILSFELMGIDRLLSGDTKTGKVMIDTQNWLYKSSRDILDESDEILNVRFELIYTMGDQRPIELAPERWVIIQHVLGLVGRLAKQFCKQYSHRLEVISKIDGAFPKIRIIHSSAGDDFLKEVVQQLLRDGLPGLSLWSIPKKLKASLLAYLTDPHKALEDSEHWSASMKNSLILLKGLFGCGVLRFAFEHKRWRVNYGLDLSRSMLAVPFHAKDIPASRAEFSHPDATIVLTCLTYYYEGLSDVQIHLSFEKLLQSDSPSEEFSRWVQDAPELASSFTHITGINLSNTRQCSLEVFPPLRFAKGLIDFYLTFVVFPAEMKEFTEKLSSSGWDIGREKEETNPTTGFSGTNDSRYVLPLSIRQRDLPAQLSTNAMVLDTLLQPENAFIDVSGVSSTGVLNAEVLLKMIVHLKPKIRVILDVGAQVLEMQNEDVAREWLSAVPESEAQAAIFIDLENEICVLDRDGRKEPLQVSPFAKQMDQCLVYLDESHTRGTDLKLPTDYRALVTLGPGLQKDRLVQACMRMRKLGKGQSVLFCSSMEVQQKILDCNGKTSGPIEISDVLRWTIAETCSHTRRSIPLWATQGLRHQHRRAVCSGATMTTELARTLQEPEAQTLEQRYGIRSDNKDPISKTLEDKLITGREEQIEEIRKKCKEFEINNFNSATLHEEQERELSPENEREEEIELPPPAKPCAHSIHPDVQQLMVDGVVNQSSSGFKPAFEIFWQTTANKDFESLSWPKNLLVTVDFAQTVQVAEKGHDSFLRPVHWVLSCHGQNPVKYVVLSPFEAQSLLPLIRQSKCVVLHVYAPRINKVVRTLETLSFCSIPAIPDTVPSPLITKLLTLFAGQLYIQNYQQYKELCSFLGLSHGEEDHVETDSDGFVKPKNRGVSSSVAIRECRFQTSPVPFLAKVFALRRKGHSIAVSHIGKMMKGELVDKDQF